MIQKSNMHVDGKSDGREVPTKCSNKSGNPLAEGMEGSRPAKENTEQTTASQTQSWGDALRGLRGVRACRDRPFVSAPSHIGHSDSPHGKAISPA